MPKTGVDRNNDRIIAYLLQRYAQQSGLEPCRLARPPPCRVCTDHTARIDHPRARLPAGSHEALRRLYANARQPGPSRDCIQHRDPSRPIRCSHVGRASGPSMLYDDFHAMLKRVEWQP